jgi:phosphate:Na+ symporter
MSDAELAAISTMHAELRESLRLAMAVFLRADAADAERLLQRKTLLRELEGRATALDLERLRQAAAGGRAPGSEGAAAASDDSGVLRVARDLRRIHSHLASFAYPVARRPKGRSAGGRVRTLRRRRSARDAGADDGDAPATVGPDADPR